MSLAELTRNSFQSGISAAKVSSVTGITVIRAALNLGDQWLALCRLFVSKNLSHNAVQSVETEISSMSTFIILMDARF